MDTVGWTQGRCGVVKFVIVYGYTAKGIEECSIQMMRGKFSKLVTESCRWLQQREPQISIEDFCLFLVTMRFSCDSKDGDDTVATNIDEGQYSVLINAK